MKKGNPKPLTPELQAELDALAAMPDSAIDTAEMAPITDWSHAVRGPFYRPSNALCLCAWTPTLSTGSNARAKATKLE